MKTPYDLSDKAAELLRKKAIRRFNNARLKINAMPFDELNVIQVCNDLYSNIDADTKKAFLELAEMVYEETDPRGDAKPDWVWVLALCDAYDPVTGYVYQHEVDRKRAYLEESIIASQNTKGPVTARRTNLFQSNRRTKNKKEIEKEFNKALKHWARMVTQYADIVTDQAMIKAFKDAGVEYVQWITERDAKVCNICEPMDGNIYRIDEVPPKQHWRCRCYLVPVLKE